MSLQIVWSPVAKQTYLDILDYIETKWTQNESKQFVERTKRVLDTISKFPKMSVYSAESDTHKCVITHQTSLFYRIKEEHIDLLFFWDNRKEPEKMKF